MGADLSEHLGALRAILGESGLRHGGVGDTLDAGFHPNNLDADVVALPRTCQHMSETVRYCNEHNIPIVTHGGRTGLTGAGGSHRPPWLRPVSPCTSFRKFVSR